MAKDNGNFRQVMMSSPDIDADDIERVTQVLKSKNLSMGRYNEDLECAFADYVGASHAITVSSGTSGLHLCIRAADIGVGDEVITTPFSFVASANCILYERATPVFVDIDESSLNIDPQLAAAAVTDRTRAILPVHVFGQPCAMNELVGLSKEHDLVLIEDACEASGSEYQGKKVGTFGKAAVFGFYPNKQMTMGEGGIVTTDDADWAARLRSLRNQGRSGMGTELRHETLGFNYRLGEMNAALGYSQLLRIETLLARRKEAAAVYAQYLQGIPGVSLLPPVATTTRLSWFVLVVRLDEHICRSDVIAHLENCGVPTRKYFSPIHLQPYFKEKYGYAKGDFPVTERVADTTLALPFHTNIPNADIEYVTNSLREAISRSSS